MSAKPASDSPEPGAPPRTRRSLAERLGAPRSRTQQLAMTGMAAAIVAVTTSALKVPMLQTGGYLNLGDVAVMLLAFLLGGRNGALAGGLGSAVADLLGGYASFAGITFLAKASEGWIAGSLGNFGVAWPVRIAGSLLAGLTMALWYLAWEAFVMGTGPALASLPGNLFQGFAGAVGALVLYASFEAAGSRRPGYSAEAS